MSSSNSPLFIAYEAIEKNAGLDHNPNKSVFFNFKDGSVRFLVAENTSLGILLKLEWEIYTKKAILKLSISERWIWSIHQTGKESRTNRNKKGLVEIALINAILTHFLPKSGMQACVVKVNP